MPDLFEQLSLILTQPYGSLAYHLVISFIFIGVLYPALVFSSEDKYARNRMLLGVSGLLISQLVIFIASTLLLVGFSTISQILPVLDRTITFIDIVIFIWLFSYISSKDPRGDIAAITIIILAVIAGGVSMAVWGSDSQNTDFINSDLALGWNISAIILSIVGQLVLSLSTSKTRNWGRIMLMAIAVGEFVNLLSSETMSTEYSVILRLSYLISFPLLYGVTGSLQSQVTHTKMIVTSIPDNLPIPGQDQQETVPGAEVRMVETGLGEQVRGINLHLFQNTMALASSTSTQEVCHLFTRYTAHALVSDICLLLSPPDSAGQVHLISAYDLIVQESFSPFSFDQSLIPGFQEAIENGEILQVSDESGDEIASFAHLIQVDRINSMLIYPIIAEDRQPLAAVCLVSPYSKYTWTEEEHHYLQDSTSAITALLERALAPDSQDTALTTLTEKLEKSENQRVQLVAEMEALSTEIAALSMLAEDQSDEKDSRQETQEQLAALQSALEVLETENSTLKEQLSLIEETSNQQLVKITELEEQAAASPEQLEELSTNLQEALSKAKNFETQLNQARAQLEFFDQADLPTDGSPIPTEQAEVIASIAQELRQPMSSISGYTDLLISESVGILGALQKKFLERVKASTDRMNHLIGDLIQITTLDSGSMALTPQPVELIEIVDAAIETTSGQFREKDIALRVDISPHLPKMHTDKDALQQILLHLLQNAGAATPEEGEIHVKVEPYNKTDGDIILIAVTDSGEGIPKEDLPRVFSRLYRADNPLIPGVGDTGVGLSIAKTLAEALGGRIWVESDQGVGSTFSVLLPITTQSVSVSEG